MARNWTPAQTAAMSVLHRTLLISAAAGSGKTATLTERIIRRLTDTENPADLSRLLVVTFTRAAASELRERLSSALSEAAAAHPTNRHLQKQLIHIGGANICTIDAFYMNAVRDHFSELGLSPSFRIADEAELNPIRERVMDDLIDEFYRKYATHLPDEGTENFHESGKTVSFSILSDNPFADLCDCLTSSKNEEKLLPSFFHLYEKLLNFPEEIERLNTEAELLHRTQSDDFFSTPHGKILFDWVKDFTAYARSFLEKALTDIQSDSAAQAAYGPSFAHDLDFIRELDSLDTYERMYAFIQTYRPIKLKPLKNASDQMKQVKEERTAVVDALKKFQSDYFRWDPDTVRRDAADMERLLRVLYDFLMTYDRRMTEEKNRRGICDFTDNRRRLLAVLRDKNGEASPVALAYRKQFDEIYIDEYQDVDEMQDEIFRLLGGNRRFMVGDIKQSIYAFKGAEPSVFARYRQELPVLPIPLTDGGNALSDADDGNSIFMSDNFRCDESIIKVTNAVCGHIFRACPESIDYRAEDDLKFSKSVPSDTYAPPLVDITFLSKPTAKKKDSEPVVADPDETPFSRLNPEAVYVAGKIAGLLRSHTCLANGKPIQPKDIVILLRTKDPIPDYIAALSAAGIPTGSEEMQSEQTGKDVLHGKEMMYLLNLLRVIDNPDSDIPLCEVLRAPFPNLSLSDVVTIRQMGNIGGNPRTKQSLFACLEEYAGLKEGDLSLKEKIQSFIAWIDRYRGWCATQPAVGLLRLLRQDEHCACRHSLAFRYLYESARTCKTAVFVSLYAFLRFFEQKLLTVKNVTGSAPTDQNGGFVQIQTIHKSKGLEYPVCFLANGGRAFSNKSVQEDLIFERRAGVSFKIYRRLDGSPDFPDDGHADETDALSPTGKADNLFHAVSALALRLTEREEEMRILYVAMTRARERLYLVGQRTKNMPCFDEGSRFPLLSCDQYMKWIYSALAAHPEVEPFVQVHEVQTDEIDMPTPLTETGRTILSDEEQGLVNRYRRILAERPLPDETERLIRDIPTKAPASRMRDDLLDSCIFYETAGDSPDTADHAFAVSPDDPKRTPDAGTALFADDVSREGIRNALRLMTSQDGNEFEGLLHAHHRPTAAEKGTAAHLFLQFCRYESVLHGGVASEIARLTEEGFISERTAQILDKTQIQAFFDSRFFAHVREAVSVEREWQFHRFVPLASLTTDPALSAALGNRTLYVQGSIDLLCRFPDGHFEVCDYKTDRLTREEREDPALLCTHMQEKHGSQLRQYALAVEEIYAQKPTKVYIYSLPLGESIAIPV